MRPPPLLKPVAVSLMLLGGAAIVRAQSVLAELTRSAGEPLLAYARATHDAGLRTLLVNGARLRMRTGSTEAPIATVLDDQSTLCRSNGSSEPIVRTERSDQGFVGCIVPRAGEDLGERMRAFVDTRDVAALGELRVTWAMRTEHGTRYVAIASEGELKLLDMFPAEGDAPGIDAPGTPRPPHARRLLSTWQAGVAPMIVSYRSELPIDDFSAQYAQTVEAAGRKADTVPSQSRDEQVVYVGGEPAALAVLVPDEGGTLISIIPLGEHATAATDAR